MMLFGISSWDRSEEANKDGAFGTTSRNRLKEAGKAWGIKALSQGESTLDESKVLCGSLSQDWWKREGAIGISAFFEIVSRGKMLSSFTLGSIPGSVSLLGRWSRGVELDVCMVTTLLLEGLTHGWWTVIEHENCTSTLFNKCICLPLELVPSAVRMMFCH